MIWGIRGGGGGWGWFAKVDVNGRCKMRKMNPDLKLGEG